MTPITDASNKLSKAVRTSDIARTSDALQMAVNQLDRFAQGQDPQVVWGNTYPDKLDAIAEYFYQGHRRYNAEDDTLVSTHQAEPLTAGISMPIEVVREVIERAGYRPMGEYRGLVEVDK